MVVKSRCVGMMKKCFDEEFGLATSCGKIVIEEGSSEGTHICNSKRSILQSIRASWRSAIVRELVDENEVSVS